MNAVAPRVAVAADVVVAHKCSVLLIFDCTLATSEAETMIFNTEKAMACTYCRFGRALGHAFRTSGKHRKVKKQNKKKHK